MRLLFIDRAERLSAARGLTSSAEKLLLGMVVDMRNADEPDPLSLDRTQQMLARALELVQQLQRGS